MEKKVNKMVELMEKNPLWAESVSKPQQDRYLISNQNPEGITKEDLEQLVEWARNQVPANRVDSNDDVSEE
jgi:hypothetical protein